MVGINIESSLDKLKSTIFSRKMFKFEWMSIFASLLWCPLIWCWGLKKKVFIKTVVISQWRETTEAWIKYWTLTE